MPECPSCCHNSAQRVWSKTRQQIADMYSAYYQRDFPVSVIEHDYSLFKCDKCGLEYADPMISGSPEFYGEMASDAVFDRPEHTQALEIIGARFGDHKIRLLDVGCANGKFLLRLPSNIDGLGIDTSEVQVDRCVNHGVKAVCEPIGDHQPESPYDVVTNFFLIEHIENPFDLISKSLSLIDDNGVVMVLFPISPLSLESAWVDPLNIPPHHLTRWNKKSLTALSSRLNAHFECYSSPVMPLGQRLKLAYLFGLHQRPVWKGTWGNVLRSAVKHPSLATKVLLDQLTQNPVDAEMVVFKKKK